MNELEDCVYSMDKSIGGLYIKLNNIGSAGTGLDLYEIVLISGDINLLSPSSVEACCSSWNILPLNGGGNDVSQQHLAQLLLILQKTAQSFLRDFLESCIGWSKDGEWSGSRECLHQTGCLHCGQEGGEPGIGHHQLGYGLWGLLGQWLVVMNCVVRHTVVMLRLVMLRLVMLRLVMLRLVMLRLVMVNSVMSKLSIWPGS